MTTLDVARTREKLQSFDLRGLFVEELGWNRPPRGLTSTTWEVQGVSVTRTPIAELAGVVVFEVAVAGGNIPDEELRRAIQAEVAQYHLEHLLIFLDADRTSSLWYWVKREGGRSYPRRHTYVQGQPGDLLIAKLSAMFVDIGELDPSGALRLTDAIRRIREALDVEPVTKSFFSDFQQLHSAVLAAIQGMSDERERRWYASVLLNRLMFVYFLQSRGFLDGGNYRYLQQRLDTSKARGTDRYFTFLQTLFFEGFAKPEDERSLEAVSLIGQVRYLNGGLFLPHQVEQRNPAIAVPDAVFDQIFALFQGYDWVLDDSPSSSQKEINPAVLGYIFEKYINQKAFGAYYTRSEITEYLCEQTIHRLIVDRVNEKLPPGAKRYETVGDLLLKPTANVCRMLLMQILPDLRLI
ncbi:MAG TPA: SAM-dependent methyltransferase, partial [Chloroflexaceae bacterium]|nr:SAM-dependent methyltransferase [Chloroflexaceae bacterium]